MKDIMVSSYFEISL